MTGFVVRPPLVTSADPSSHSGIKTAKVDVDLVERRLKVAQQDYEVRYGKAKR